MERSGGAVQSGTAQCGAEWSGAAVLGVQSIAARKSLRIELCRTITCDRRLARRHLARKRSPRLCHSYTTATPKLRHCYANATPLPGHVPLHRLGNNKLTHGWHIDDGVLMKRDKAVVNIPLQVWIVVSIPISSRAGWQKSVFSHVFSLHLMISVSSLVTPVRRYLNDDEINCIEEADRADVVIIIMTTGIELFVAMGKALPLREQV